MVGIHVVGLFVDIHKSDSSASLRNCLGGCNKCIRNSNYLVTGADPGSNQSKPQSIRTAIYGHTIFAFTELSELVFKCLYLWTTHKRGLSEAVTKNCNQFFFELEVGGNQIEKRDFHVLTPVTW